MAMTEVDRASQLARDELIGRDVRVAVSNDPTLVGLTGTIVDETMKTLSIEAGGARHIVGKIGQTFAFNLEGEDVLLDGKAIAYRPEDRIRKARVKR